MKKRSTVSNTSFFLLKRVYAKLVLGGLALVGHGQFLSAFPAAVGQHLAAVGGLHSVAEAVLVNSFSA
jgi:hypothetical protein